MLNIFETNKSFFKCWGIFYTGNRMLFPHYFTLDNLLYLICIWVWYSTYSTPYCYCRCISSKTYPYGYG